MGEKMWRVKREGDIGEGIDWPNGGINTLVGMGWNQRPGDSVGVSKGRDDGGKV